MLLNLDLTSESCDYWVWDDWDEDFELAKHRLDTAREAARSQRFQAQEKTRLRRERALKEQEAAQKAKVEDGDGLRPEFEMGHILSRKRDSVRILQQSGTLSEMLLNDALMGVDDSHEDGSADFVQYHAKPSPGAGACGLDPCKMLTTTFESETSSQAGDEPGLGTRRLSHTVLKTIHLRSARRDRMDALRRLGSSRQKQTKMARLLNARRAEFDELPPEQRQIFGKAFIDATTAGSNGTVEALLDSRALRHALREFGLVATTRREKIEVQELCSELAVMGKVDFYTFCFEGVPRARQILRDHRKELLQKYFQIYDLEETGVLTVADCARVVENLYALEMDGVCFQKTLASFEALLSAAMEARPEKADGDVPFDIFESLIAQLQEQTVRCQRERTLITEQNEGLGPDERAHRHELLVFHEAFTMTAGTAPGLTRPQLNVMLAEFGLLSAPETQEELGQLFRIGCGSSKECVLGFPGFLRIIRWARKMFLSARQKLVVERFTRLDKAQTGSLPQYSISKLLESLGLVPHCREDQAQIWRLLNEVPTTDAGEVDLANFEQFALHVSERLKAAQRYRAHKTAVKLRVTQRDVAAYKEMFHDLDPSGEGSLTCEQVTQVLELMDVHESPEAIEAAMTRCGFQLHPTGGDPAAPPVNAAAKLAGLRVDFDGFLRLLTNFVGNVRMTICAGKSTSTDFEQSWLNCASGLRR